MTSKIAIIDLGGQYCHLISRRLREFGVQTDTLPPETPSRELRGYAGVVLSGGPSSVHDVASPRIDSDVLDLGLPVFGICYGHQLIAESIGGSVERAEGEYGFSQLRVRVDNGIFFGTPKLQTVWMSHSDSVTSVPEGISVLADTRNCRIAAFADPRRKLYSVQFHPEVVHTDWGRAILENFVTRICGIHVAPSGQKQVNALVGDIRVRAGDRSVFFLVSGGVDSTVAFVLCAKALRREQVLGLYVDTGLMRTGETDELRSELGKRGLLDRLVVRDESSRFLTALNGVCDPEEKRRVIGRLFVQVQAEAMRDLGINSAEWLLGQGTIYPDTIESGGENGRAALIKTHHNRCREILELIDRNLVIEPLADFYKDEVKRLGDLLQLDPKLTHRWPFPGPGLAIRCIGADHRGMRRGTQVNLPNAFSDYRVTRVPVFSVGVQGDQRTFKEVAAAVGPEEIDYPGLQKLSAYLCSLQAGFNRVLVWLAGRSRHLADARIEPCGVSQGRIETLRAADHAVREILEQESLTHNIWQFPVVLIPFSFESGGSVVLRPVYSEDGMTARFGRLPPDVLEKITTRLMTIDGVDSVFLDVTDKPPATIEWE